MKSSKKTVFIAVLSVAFLESDTHARGLMQRIFSISPRRPVVTAKPVVRPASPARTNSPSPVKARQAVQRTGRSPYSSSPHEQPATVMFDPARGGAVISQPSQPSRRANSAPARMNSPIPPPPVLGLPSRAPQVAFGPTSGVAAAQPQRAASLQSGGYEGLRLPTGMAASASVISSTSTSSSSRNFSTGRSNGPISLVEATSGIRSGLAPKPARNVSFQEPIQTQTRPQAQSAAPSKFQDSGYVAPENRPPRLTGKATKYNANPRKIVPTGDTYLYHGTTNRDLGTYRKYGLDPKFGGTGALSQDASFRPAVLKAGKNVLSATPDPSVAQSYAIGRMENPDYPGRVFRFKASAPSRFSVDRNQQTAAVTFKHKINPKRLEYYERGEGNAGIWVPLIPPKGSNSNKTEATSSPSSSNSAASSSDW